MAESKLLEGDKDDWFYHSLERYQNLYMFELEFPVDALEVINETSICLSGLQNFSKKCEIIQLAIPPKLLPKDLEEGLCKDRDFTIISGGYASSRILQIKSIANTESCVATTQIGINGVTLFQLGDDEHALIKEKSTIDIPETLGAGVIDSKGNHLIATGTRGDHLYELVFDSSCSNTGLLTHKLPKNTGRITKVKYWDDSSISFSTEKGIIGIFDVRSAKFIGEFSATKSQTENLILQYTHDVIPEKYKIGVADSCGGYETFDLRSVKTTSSSSGSRVILPRYMNSDGILSGKFNLQYSPQSATGAVSNFILTGMKEDSVEIYEESETGISPVFIHDGHLKVVSHALWHPSSERLLLSCSIDAMLHAWQYQVNELSTSKSAEEEPKNGHDHTTDAVQTSESTD